MAEVNQQVIDNFEIPEDLAKELSDKFEEVEKSLIPITAKIEAIKNRITKEFVPEEYNSTKYMWNYESWEVARNKVQVIELY